VVQTGNRQKKGDKMKKAKRNNLKLLKTVENTEVTIETKKKQDEEKAYNTFNEKTKELIRGEIRNLFEGANEIDVASKVYNFSFYLAQELIFDKIPVGSYQRALNAGTKEAQQNYLSYLNDEFSIKPREAVEVNEQNRTLN